MRVTGPCTTAEMLWDWALAEWESSRFGSWYPNAPEAVERLRSGAPYDHAQIFDQRIASTVATVHNLLLKDVLPARLRWRRVLLAPDELAPLRILNLPEFRTLLPHSAVLGDMVALLESNPAPLRDIPLLRAYHEVRDSFDPALIRGAPILLAEHEEGPFHIMEGHRRLASTLAQFSDGRRTPHEVAAILGIWPGLKAWPYYHDVDAPFRPVKPQPRPEPETQPLK